MKFITSIHGHKMKFITFSLKWKGKLFNNNVDSTNTICYKDCRIHWIMLYVRGFHGLSRYVFLVKKRDVAWLNWFMDYTCSGDGNTVWPREFNFIDLVQLVTNFIGAPSSSADFSLDIILAWRLWSVWRTDSWRLTWSCSSLSWSFTSSSSDPGSSSKSFKSPRAKSARLTRGQAGYWASSNGIGLCSEVNLLDQL